MTQRRFFGDHQKTADLYKFSHIIIKVSSSLDDKCSWHLNHFYLLIFDALSDCVMVPAPCQT